MIVVVLAVLLLGGVINLLNIQSSSAQETKIPKERTFIKAEAGQLVHLNLLGVGDPGIIEMGEFRLIYEPLAMYDTMGTKGIFYPVLAENWKWVDDKTFEIYLQPEAHFRDGSPVTSEDVIFTLNMKNEYRGLMSSLFEKIESMDAVDEKTIRIKFTEFAKIDIMGLLKKMVLPKDRWSELIDEWGENYIKTEFRNMDPDEMNGSGPYTLYSDTGERTVFKHVDNYWGNQIGRYFLPEYIMELYVDSYEKMETLLEMGQNEWSWSVTRDRFPIQLEDPNIGCYDRDADTLGGKIWPPTGLTALDINWDNPLLRETWFRHALAYGIPWENVLEKAGMIATSGSPANFMVLPSTEAYVNEDVISRTYETKRNGYLSIKYDKEKAISILENHLDGNIEDGWKYKGEDVSLGLVALEGSAQSMAEMSAIGHYLESDLGIPTNLEYLSLGVRYVQISGGTFEDLACLAACLASPALPVTSLIGNLTAEAPPLVWSWNFGRWYQSYFNENYPETPNTASQVKELVEQLSLYEVGSEDSIRIAKELQEIYVPQMVPLIPVGQYNEGVHWSQKDWVNWPTKDDPMLYPTEEKMYGFIMNCYPRDVITNSFDLTPGTVEAGEPVTAKVTLTNKGDADHRYAVYVRKGPAKLGPGPEILGHKVVMLPAGETKSVEIEFSIDELGSYTITVDDWRIGKYDPGDPIEKILTVGPGVGPTTLTVDTTPVKGEVFVDGDSWGTAPQTKEVDPGTYTISFGDVENYSTPENQTVTLAEEETKTVVITYEPSAPAEEEIPWTYIAIGIVIIVIVVLLVVKRV